MASRFDFLSGLIGCSFETFDVIMVEEKASYLLECLAMKQIIWQIKFTFVFPLFLIITVCFCSKGRPHGDQDVPTVGMNFIFLCPDVWDLWSAMLSLAEKKQPRN